MADLKLQPDENNKLDLSISNNDFAIDHGLSTSVFLSLSKFRYDEDTSKNSWFADEVLTTDIIKGSRIYLLFSETITDNTQNIVNKYAQECLDWMLTDKVASDVEISSLRSGSKGFVLSILITKPDSAIENFEYFLNWDAQKLEII